MVEKSFKVGDLVWARMKACPDWPARITVPPPNENPKKRAHYVYFFGSKNYSWVTDDRITHYTGIELHKEKKMCYSFYKEAVKEIKIEFLKSLKNAKTTVKVEKEKKEEAPKKLSKVKKSNETAKERNAKLSFSSNYKLPKKHKSKEDSLNSSQSKLKNGLIIKRHSMPVEKAVRQERKSCKLPKKCKTEKHSLNCSQSKVKKNHASPQKSNVIKQRAKQSAKNRKSCKSTKKRKMEEDSFDIPRKRRKIERRDESPLTVEDKKYPLLTMMTTTPLNFGDNLSSTNFEVNNISEEEHYGDKIVVKEDMIKKKHKIGFLGIGMMGRRMVKNLIKYNHTLTIWDRSRKKCDEFEGLEKVNIALSPANVVENSDITFCCVSDPNTIKTIMFGEDGVLAGLKNCERGSRGYVEMSSIDSKTSKELADAITETGMKYLEAPVIGSHELAEEGSILILGSGDRALFYKCADCFHAMAEGAHFMSYDVGTSANFNIISCMLLEAVHAVLAEVLSLTQCLKQNRDVLLDMFELLGIISKSLMLKGKAMIEENKEPDTYLKHQQKVMNFFFRLSESNNHPTPVAAAAHEVYVHNLK